MSHPQDEFDFDRLIARLVLVTHLTPTEILQMTPDQTEVILEEYVAMNKVDGGEETAPPGALGVSTQAAKPTAPEDSDLGSRLQREFRERLAKQAEG